jgi:hypothetical protein
MTHFYDLSQPLAAWIMEEEAKSELRVELLIQIILRPSNKLQGIKATHTATTRRRWKYNSSCTAISELRPCCVCAGARLALHAFQTTGNLHDDRVKAAAI